MFRSLVAVSALFLQTATAIAQDAMDQPTSATPAARNDAGAASQADDPSEPLEIIVVGKRPDKRDAPSRVPPRCAKRPGDPADLVQVGMAMTSQRVIAPDRNGVLALQEDREKISGPIWQRAGTGIGQYVFRVPDDGTPMCIGAARSKPSGWGQLRRIVRTTKDMRGRYVHFSTLVAARDAKLIRFWVAIGGAGARVTGGDTNQAPLHGTFGWLQADVIVGPVPFGADHISFGFLLWGKGDLWVLDPRIEIKTRDEVRGIPALPVTLKKPLGEQTHDPF